MRTLQEQTLRSLAEAPFNKIRMGLFPKSFLFNANEPERFVFPRARASAWDTTRFDLEYFAHLETRSTSWPRWASRPTSSSSTPTIGGASRRSVPPSTTGTSPTSRDAWLHSPTCGGRWRTSTTCSRRSAARTGTVSPAWSAPTTRTVTRSRSTTGSRSSTTPLDWATHCSIQRGDYTIGKVHRPLEARVGQARHRRRIRVRGRHRPGVGQSPRGGDGAALLGRDHVRRIPHARRDVLLRRRRVCGGRRAARCRATACRGSRSCGEIIDESPDRTDRRRSRVTGTSRRRRRRIHRHLLR